MFVDVVVGYKDCGGPYATATLYVSTSDDEDNDKPYGKTMVGYYPLPMTSLIDIEVIRNAIQPGIAHLADSIRKLTL